MQDKICHLKPWIRPCFGFKIETDYSLESAKMILEMRQVIYFLAV